MISRNEGACGLLGSNLHCVLRMTQFMPQCQTLPARQACQVQKLEAVDSCPASILVLVQAVGQHNYATWTEYSKWEKLQRLRHEITALTLAIDDMNLLLRSHVSAVTV